MLKQKYFLTGIFILSAERQPIKLAWRKIVWLQGILYYNSNGNLIQDLNKKITEIQYNCLNLRSCIEFEDGGAISYLYDAKGIKFRTRM